MKSQTLAKLGLAALASLFLLTACASAPEPAGGFGSPMPSLGSPDH